MKKTILFILIMLFLSVIHACSTSDINPFELDIDFYNQTKTRLNLTDNEKRLLYESMVFYTENISFESQNILINSNEATDNPLDLRLESTILTNNLDTNIFRNYEILDINTLGYEQLIDTGGLSGRLSLYIELFDDFTDTYFTSKIELSNPPFKITAEENQVMTTAEATFELPVLLDVSIDLTPETFVGFIDPQVNLLEVYEMPYGHYLTSPIVIDNLINGLSIEATIEMIIIDNFVIYATITSLIDSIIIPVNGLIENTESLDVSLELDVVLDFLYNMSMIELPSSSDLQYFERVDTFTLPDVTTIFGT
jgi:hypothetical protein